jgi:hypothetical protein
MNDIQKENYKKMDKLGFLTVKKEGYIKIKNPSYTQLSVDLLSIYPSGAYRIAMTHWSEQNGDLMHDPDMECVINPSEQTVSARTYQQDYLGIYDAAEIYDDDSKVTIISQKAEEMDEFLSTWLDNLKSQGFGDVLNHERSPLLRIKKGIKKLFAYKR